MPTVVLASSLLQQTEGRSRIEVSGSTPGEALRALERSEPRLKGWILDDQGRLRDHVNVFVGESRVPLSHPLSQEDEVFVIQAISGGSESELELLVGTKKGLFILRGPRTQKLEVVARLFPGQVVDYAMRDRRTGRYFAAATHGQFGPHLHFTDDPAKEWTQAEGPSFPSGANASVERIWVVEAGVEEEVLWAGVAPAALFKSTNGGQSWSLNEALWNDPSRSRWEGGLGGLALHSICPWPGEPGRLTVAISAVGVWLTEDGGETWSRHATGLVARYLAEEAGLNTIMHCVHKLVRSPVEPSTLYLQFHGGVYRSDDGARNWIDIGSDSGLPADFGFPIVVDPRDPNRAFVIPLAADVDRVTPGGKVRVYETRDRGSSWRSLDRGLPQANAYLTVLRQGFCHDGREPLGLYFGTESGVVFASVDDGENWTTAAENLPPITSVRVSA